MTQIKYNKHEYNKIYNTLDDYLRFCKTFGHPYNEAAIGDITDPNYRAYKSFKEGTRIPNNWIADARKYNLNIFAR